MACAAFHNMFISVSDLCKQEKFMLVLLILSRNTSNAQKTQMNLNYTLNKQKVILIVFLLI